MSTRYFYVCIYILLFGVVLCHLYGSACVFFPPRGNPLLGLYAIGTNTLSSCTFLVTIVITLRFSISHIAPYIRRPVDKLWGIAPAKRQKNLLNAKCNPGSSFTPSKAKNEIVIKDYAFTAHQETNLQLTFTHFGLFNKQLSGHNSIKSNVLFALCHIFLKNSASESNVRYLFLHY